MKFLERNLLWFAVGLFLVVGAFVAYAAWTRRKPAAAAAKGAAPKAEAPVSPVNPDGRLGQKAELDAPAIPIRYKSDVQDSPLQWKDDPGETWYSSDEG